MKIFCSVKRSGGRKMWILSDLEVPVAESRLLEGMVFGRKVASSPARPRPPRYYGTNERWFSLLSSRIRVRKGGGDGKPTTCYLLPLLTGRILRVYSVDNRENLFLEWYVRFFCSVRYYLCHTVKNVKNKAAISIYLESYLVWTRFWKIWRPRVLRILSTLLTKSSLGMVSVWNI